MSNGNELDPPPKGTFAYYKWLKSVSKKKWNKQHFNKKKTDHQPSQSSEAKKKRCQRLKAKSELERKMNNKVRQREYTRKFREKKEPTEIHHNTDYKHRMEKTRALNVLKSSLPETPRRRVSLLKTYLQKASPTVKTLEKMKIVRSPEEVDQYTAAETAMKDIKVIMDTTKTQRSSDSVLTRKLIFAAISGESVKDKKHKTVLAKRLGVKRNNMTAGSRTRTKILKSDTSSWKLTEKKTRNNNIPEEHKRQAYDFWLKSGISRPTGNKKDIKRERLDTNVFVSHMVHVLEKSQTEVYSEFRSENPDIKMSQRTFERLKPFFVRPVRAGDRNTCLCRYHVELKTVFDSCMKERKKILDTKNESNLNTTYPVYQSIHEVVTSTLCHKLDSEEYHNISCLKRECASCGAHTFKVMTDEQCDTLVDWERFDYVTVSVKGDQTRKKIMLVKKRTFIRELFSYFMDLLSSFPAHQFRATWQRQQLKHVTTNISQNECVVVHDFSENYRVAGKDELQSSYFQRTEVTLHVSILYRHAILEIDGVESCTEAPRIISEQFLVFSNDDKHDHHFVHRVQELIRDYLKSISYAVDTMHEFTDGCQSQYKSRHCMGDVSYSCDDLGYKTIIRNFFETSHAKGPQDAAGGYVKRQLDLVVLRGTTVINTAKDAYLYARRNLATTSDKSESARRIFQYIDQESIVRNRDRQFKPVINNRDIHQIITGKEGILTLRSVSCYTCETCADGFYDQCTNNNLTNARNVTMQREPSVNLHQASTQTNDITYSVAETVKRGDLVVVYTDDSECDYYLLKATHAHELLMTDESDDWGNSFKSLTPVIRGFYYNKTGPLSYKIIPKKETIISANSVICIISDITASSKLSIPECQHEEILGWVEECSI